MELNAGVSCNKNEGGSCSWWDSQRCTEEECKAWVFLVIRPNPTLHFAPFLSVHFSREPMSKICHFFALVFVTLLDSNPSSLHRKKSLRRVLCTLLGVDPSFLFWNVASLPLSLGGSSKCQLVVQSSMLGKLG